MTDTELLDWLESHPRLADIVVDGKVHQAHFYGVSGHPGMRLREIIEMAAKWEKSK